MKRFYVDIGDMDPTEIPAYMQRVCNLLTSIREEQNEEVILSPLHTSTVDALLKSPRVMQIRQNVIAQGHHFFKGDSVLFLGEIINMPGHCAFVSSSGQVLWGLRTDIVEEKDV